MLYRGVKHLFALALVFGALPALAKGSQGREPLSVVVSLDYNTPAPSAMGLNLGLNLTSFLRVSGGFGTYIKSGDSLMKTYSLGLASTFGYVLTLGQVRYSAIYDYLGGNSQGWESVLTRGAEATLLVPGLSLSPALGVGYASYLASDGAYGVLAAGSAHHVYYNGGLDLAHKSFHAKGGMHYSPQLPSKLQKTYYFGLGVTF